MSLELFDKRARELATLQKEFLQFHDNIKIGSYDENSDLREKRDTLISALENALSDEKVPGTDKPLTFSKFDQGSYAMNTGIKPQKGDYDIDVGVVFDISSGEYESHKLKKLVRDSLNKHNTRTVTYNRPCITVEYASGYHVDLAIYAKNDGDYDIAWGKEFSNGDRKWEPSDPKGLTDWVKNIGSGEEQRKQYRRCIRALKKWKEKAFSINGSEAPPSIGLTIQAGRNFSYQSDNDLSALVQIVRNTKNSFSQSYDSDCDEWLWTVKSDLPVNPYKNVYYKMTNKQLDKFYHKLSSLLEALEAAQNEQSEAKASKILHKVFGDDFPILEDSKATKTAPFVPTGNNA